ncbi:uncharacterized protein METZ01_LOCUS1777 [marine metagenome]|jgi:hypothetical protein|uniref:Uncharacterized protein n=1 Tax=marine metagenome TaxID=408172 RepID=A0A381N5N9_9ZZZZ
MENFVGWYTHPNRKNLFINKKYGFLYRRTKVGSFHLIPQKMTLHQEIC